MDDFVDQMRKFLVKNAQVLKIKLKTGVVLTTDYTDYTDFQFFWEFF